MRKLKKGFTIIELVIVIAVIAVLTAVLVPTFVHLSKRAKEATDKATLTSLNIALKAEEASTGRNARTMHEAMEMLKNEGFYASALITKSTDYEIVYSVEDHEFCLSTDSRITNANMHKFFHIYSEMPSPQTFSIYANDDWAEGAVTNLVVGFDVGYTETVNTLSFVGADKEVVIRTMGQDLSINAEGSTVHHYDNVKNLSVTKVGGESFHEYGYINTLVKFESGRFVAETGAEFRQSREDVLAIIGENANNIGSVPDTSFGVPDAFSPVEITQDNYATVFSENPTAEKFILKETITVATTWYIWGTEQQKRTVELDLGGKMVTSPAGDSHRNLIDFSYCDLTLKNGSIVNDNTPDDGTLYGVVGGGCTLTAENVQFSGSVKNRIGVIHGSLVIKLDECDLHNGLISAWGATVEFDCVGTFKVSTVGWDQYPMGLPPTVVAGAGYTLTSSSESYMPSPVEDEIYKEYTFALA